jgi:hypothetical protein
MNNKTIKKEIRKKIKKCGETVPSITDLLSS